VEQVWHSKARSTRLTVIQDLHEFLAGPNLIPTAPHPVTGEAMPVTLGHEFSGIVEQVGPLVTRFRPGDRVVVEPIIYDGTCASCRAGRPNCCAANGFVGISGYGGGLAEHVVLHERYVTPLPAGISLKVGGGSLRSDGRGD
jgi:threonine dehydrogenase-like Zn-dependent dehydrogenase